MFGSKICCETKIFLGPKFVVRPKSFIVQIFLPKNYSWVNIFLGQQFLGSNNFLGPTFFGLKITYGSTDFLAQKYFLGQLFCVDIFRGWVRNLFGPKIIRGQKLWTQKTFDPETIFFSCGTNIIFGSSFFLSSKFLGAKSFWVEPFSAEKLFWSEKDFGS